MIHSILIIAVIAIVVVVQLKYFFKLKKRLSDFRTIFSKKELENYDSLIVVSSSIPKAMELKEKYNRLIEKKKELFELEDNDYELNKLEEEIESIVAEYKMLPENDHYEIKKEDVFSGILNSINKYLYKNKETVSDFNIMKDIVERSCDVEEEELHTLVPIPLYCGLVGTMAGILVGVMYLVLSGSLTSLLTSSNNTGADGVSALLSGVGIAMFCSILGVVLTTYASLSLKDAKKEEEEGKHEFLSWIQANLLPTLSNGMSDTIRRFTENLQGFNEMFSSNTRKLQETLRFVNKTSQGQAEIISASNQIIESINNLKIKQIASANIEVYDKLKDCSEEIGTLSEYLKTVNSYLTKVNSLSKKLDDADNRVRMIEEMAHFFKEERASLEMVKGKISMAVGEMDSEFSTAMSDLQSKLGGSINQLANHTTEQTQTYEKTIEEQRKVLESKTSDMSKLVADMNKMADVKDSISKMGKAISEQNQKLEKLANSIKEMANAKASNGTITPFMPKWVKWGAISLGGILFLSCTLSIISVVSQFIQ
ncbi:MAG: hypothetical protein J6Q03_02230 [Paludibacteraceae bacterium]|nr:hypothetical protein [Paludibacteraceae bacterium]